MSINNNINFFRQNIAWLPQSFDTNLKVEEFLQLPFTYKANKHLRYSKDDVFKLFSEFELDNTIYKKPINIISGGEKQRIGLISVLLLKRKFLLLDEAVASLDNHLKDKVIFHVFNNKDLTILSNSHDDKWINECTKVIEL